MSGLSSFDHVTSTSELTSLIESSNGPEPIAIVGIGCRLPGDVTSASECWRFLQAGRDARGEFPRSRFNIDGFFSSKMGNPGCLPMRGGYFLSQDIRAFDNAFFGINNLEATHMDPQQRNLLEVVYECFESAGLRLEDVAGSNVGCYVGDFTYDFLVMQTKDDEAVHRYSSTGKGRTILSNRISHAFDLHGPSLTLDTACSSSIYSLHLACRALLQKDCDAAVVASANLIQTPEQQLDVTASGVLSPTSTCHTFDASADGYGRADAVGALYLKRLSDAIRDNDPIRSIIRATSTNSNGQTPGITLPSAKCQAEVIEKAYRFAGLSVKDTDYWEFHGTGTPVGDPIEVSAVAHSQSISPRNEDDIPLLIGAVKPNFGHSEAASGITSVIKATLALENLQIPATIGIEKLNPKIPWDEYNLEVVRKLTPWPRCDNVPRVSINSFGYGGANAHCILEDADTWVGHLLKRSDSVYSEDSFECLSMFPEQDHEQTFLLPFSAKTSTSVIQRIKAFADLDHSRLELSDLAYTLSARRSTFDHRSFAIVQKSSWQTDFMRSKESPVASVSETAMAPIAFIFTGQGAQWPQMGKRLFQSYSAFRNSILRVDYHLRTVPNSPSWSLMDLLSDQGSHDINQPIISQTICTAVQIALVDLLSCWNVIPESVVGHSSGEIAAAYAAGHISATYAIEIAYLRGLVVSQNKAAGAMLAVSLPFEEAQDLVFRYSSTHLASIACHNSPENVTLSGDEDIIDAIHNYMQETGKFSRKLKTGGQAYHSHHMKKFGKLYESLLNNALSRETKDSSIFIKSTKTQSSSSNIPMFSTVINRVVTNKETAMPAYWRANLESPVLFDSAIKNLAGGQARIFIEIGPHHALQMPVQQIEASDPTIKTKSSYFSALVRNKCSERTALALVGTLWAQGHAVDFEAIRNSFRWGTNEQPRVIHDLPNYPWDHSRILWKEPQASIEYRNRQFPRDELIGSRISSVNARASIWRGLLDIKNVPWLADHKLGTNIVLPGACYLSMANRACQQLLAASHEVHSLELRNVNIEKVMLLQPESSLEVLTELRPSNLTSLEDRVDTWEFVICSVENGRTTRHASGVIAAIRSATSWTLSSVVNGTQLEAQSSKLWYSRFLQQSLAFGDHFQSLNILSVPRQRDQMVAEAELRVLSPEVHNEFQHLYPFDIHPITTDATFQTGLVATAKGILNELSGRVPVSIDHISICRTGKDSMSGGLRARASAKIVGPGSAVGQCELQDVHGNVVMEVRNVKVATLQEQEIVSIPRAPMLENIWIPELTKINRHNVDSFAKLVSGSNVIEPSVAAYQLASIVNFKAMLSADCKILLVCQPDRAFAESFVTALHQLDSISSIQMDFGLLQESGSVLILDSLDGEIPEVVEYISRGLVLSEQSVAYDAIIMYTDSTEAESQRKLGNSLLGHINHQGFTISIRSDLQDSPSDSGIFFDDSSDESEKGFDSFSQDSSFSTHVHVLALPQPNEESQLTIMSIKQELTRQAGQRVLIATGTPENSFNTALEKEAIADGFATTIISFDQLNQDHLGSEIILIVTAEMEKSFLSSANEDQLAKVQLIANHGSKVLWICDKKVSSNGPGHSAIFGLSRSIMAGNPAIRFATLELDDSELNIRCTTENIKSILRTFGEKSTDLEFRQKEGILFVSRLLPNDACNRQFEQKKRPIADLVKLSEAQNCELHIRDPGQFDTLEFRHMDPDVEIPHDHVRVSVQAVAINAKDLYTLSGKVDTVANTCSCEFSGVIAAIGSAVSGFKVGDRIVSSAPGRYRPVETVPATVCYHLTAEEDFVEMASVPMVYGTAIHALCNLAKLREGESVLIHSAAGGVGTAAILLAKSIGAKIFATVGNDKKKCYLVDQYDLNPDYIFNSRDTSFLSGIMNATSGRGVDVVLNSLTGARLHASLEACAKFGRFIEIGKRDILDSGSLNMSVFQKGITFSAFDLHELYYAAEPKHRLVYEQLLVDAVELYRSLGYTGTTTTSFDVSDIGSAFRYFANSSRIGKVAITYQDLSSLVPVVTPKFVTRFSAQKSYLLVGCLGGLGRSISRYMFQNGARNFTFLGRSGTAKAPAAMLVADLKQAGAHVTVVKGDVCSLSDVQAAVQTLTMPLGGVIQAAMDLSEALFPIMTHSAWHKALDPKIRGTWNLHKAISSHERDLDFFLMTSSIAGTIGFSTEANYCAANCFLDHFATYRREQGLKATSVALGPVAGAGIVHEHPEIENVFFRGGITEVSEDDMMCVIDIALSSQDEAEHLITGLEPSRAKAGFEDSWQMLAPDPRLHHITAAHDRSRLSATMSSAGTARSGETIDARLIAALTEAGADNNHSSAGTDGPLGEILHTVLSEQLGKLVLMDPANIGTNMYLMDVGMDSTLAAQFRTYVFRATGVDVSFVMLMDAKSRMADLVDFVAGVLIGE